MSRRESIIERWSRCGPLVRGSLAAVALAVIAIALAIVAVAFVGVGEDEGTVVPERIVEAARAPASDGDSDADPFVYESDRRTEFERRAAIGSAHVIYDKSPGGVVASAERTARWRERIEPIAAAHDVDPAVMEAMILLESAGRPQVIAGDDPEAASGLAQILAPTGIDFLGMRIDLARSRVLTDELAATEAELAEQRLEAAVGRSKDRARARQRVRELSRRAPELIRERAEIDERFDPDAALGGMADYLQFAEERFDRRDLAVVSYHMGIGNLENVIERYNQDADDGFDTDQLEYARIYFDSSPLRNPRAWSLLGSLGDDSATYYWRVLAAAEIMRLWRQDPERLAEQAELQTAKATSEEVFHPASETEIFEGPDALAQALDDGGLVRIPTEADFGFRVGPELGELARELEVDRSLYRALRPEALAALIYLGAGVQAINDGKGTLKVTSAVRDRAYQEALTGINVEATTRYSLHTTGYSFDILRKYSSDRQAEAFQFMLDRLSALAVIDYAVEPAAIHVTVSDGAKALLGD